MAFSLSNNGQLVQVVARHLVPMRRRTTIMLKNWKRQYHLLKQALLHYDEKPECEGDDIQGQPLISATILTDSETDHCVRQQRSKTRND
jgi:hypothetical protein